ncbi:MAG: hypothetical protein HDQ93_02150 [Desulfovibrio sp.]|nr:hypothetical protein [Desulfovibrio sp.]
MRVILGSISEANASFLTYINADFFVKNASQNRSSTIDRLLAGTRTLIIEEPERLPLALQEKLATEFSRAKMELASRGDKSDLKFLTISGVDISSLVDKGEFSPDLLDILQTKKIIIMPGRNDARDDEAAPGESDGESAFHNAWSNNSKENDPAISSNNQRAANDSERDPEKTRYAQIEEGQFERPDDYSDLDIEKSVEDAERKCIMKALRLSNGRKDRAAELLKMNLRTFHRRCARLGI